MTPSHHGLGSVVLCTAGHHTVAVDMRHVAGTGRVGRDRDHVVDLATGLGLAADRVRAGAAPADAGRPRVARRREGVAAVRHQRAHPAQRRSPAPRRRATSRRWPRSTASGTWSSTCARSPAAARTPPRDDAGRARRLPEPPRKRRRAAPGRAWPAAPRSAIWSCSRPRRRGPRRIRWPTRSARRRSSRSRSSPTSRRCRWRRRTCAASATGAAARSSSSTCRPG